MVYNNLGRCRRDYIVLASENACNTQPNFMELIMDRVAACTNHAIKDGA